jgi:hypothetical protein
MPTSRSADSEPSDDPTEACRVRPEGTYEKASWEMPALYIAETITIPHYHNVPARYARTLSSARRLGMLIKTAIIQNSVIKCSVRRGTSCVAALELNPPPKDHGSHKTTPAIGGTVHDPPILRHQTQPCSYLPAPTCHRRIHPAVSPYHPKLTQTFRTGESLSTQWPLPPSPRPVTASIPLPPPD